MNDSVDSFLSEKLSNLKRTLLYILTEDQITILFHFKFFRA